jgi:hypothetical protein
MFGPSDAFYLSRWRRRIAWFVVSFFPLIVAWQSIWAWLEREGRGVGIPWELYALGAAANALVWFYVGWGLLHRSRPIVQVSDPEVEWGSVFYFTGKRRRIAIDEIRSVGWKNPRRLRLETRSLAPVTINVMEIAKEERQKLYDAIARRISEP